MKFKQFMKNQGFIASIFMGIFYAVAMLWIFLIAYSALPGNTKKLNVAIVNDDVGELGEQIANELGNNLPFNIEWDNTNEQALQKLDDNKIALVIHIPQDFSFLQNHRRSCRAPVAESREIHPQKAENL